MSETRSTCEARVQNHLVRRYAVPYQPTSFREWKSAVILGTAYKHKNEQQQFEWKIQNRCSLTVDMIDVSSNMRNPTKDIENMVKNSLKPVRYSWSFLAGASEFRTSIASSLDAAFMSGIDEDDVEFSSSSFLARWGSAEFMLGDTVLFMGATGSAIVKLLPGNRSC